MKVICPKCFAETESGKLYYVCVHAGCAREDMPVLPAVAAEGEKKAGSAAKHSACLACGSPLLVQVCPSCGFTIREAGKPGAASEEKVLPISIVGSEGCGKSNFLSVLINQIRQDMAEDYQCALHPRGGDATINRYKQLYYTPLFVEGQCVSSTEQEDVAPLEYSLRFTKTGQAHNLVFYDACGANFRNERTMADYNRSIYHSKGLFLFLDPTQIPYLREQANARKWPQNQGDIGALLARSIQLIRHASGQSTGKLKVPVAVCLTKLDMIRPLLPPASFLRYPSRHADGVFDANDHTACSMEVRSLIESWDGVDLVNQITSQFETVAFFAFSALGSSPGAGNRIQRISPHRVLDPLLWLLWRNSVIPSKKA